MSGNHIVLLQNSGLLDHNCGLCVLLLATGAHSSIPRAQFWTDGSYVSIVALRGPTLVWRTGIVRVIHSHSWMSDFAPP